jgi:hypothetical protein
MAMGVINQSTCSSGDIDLAIDVRFGANSGQDRFIAKEKPRAA